MSAQGVKRKLSAILSADVKGYSRLMAEDEVATVQTLTTYREVMTSLIQQHRGRVVDSPGDNLLAEFSSVVDAVQCAVAVQKELQARNAELPEGRRMEFRIGINLGDVIEEGDRIYGDGVNIAARLEGLAEGGGICISGTAFDQVKNKLSVGYQYVGKQTVKNIPDPVRAYKVLMEPEAAGKVIGEEEPKPTKWGWKTVVAGVLALVVLAGGLVWNFYFRAPRIEPASVERMAYSLPDKPSIAVLPFDNLSGDPNQDYLSDGITEEIITSLSKVPQLFVIARNSAFTYKGKPVKVQNVAEELGVRYVLEGSVRKSGNRIRITAQLVDAIKGYHLWAERYDRDFKDLFALQDEITMKILSALRFKLTEGERARRFAKGTKNLRAYEKLLQVRELHLRFDKEANVMARKICEEVITLDPEYAQAYLLLGLIHIMDNVLGISKNPRESLKRAHELAIKGLSLDDTLATPHLTLSFTYSYKKQHDKSVEHAEQAVALEPGSAIFHATLGRSLAYAGRYNEAIEALEKALRMDPFPDNWYFFHLFDAYINTDRHEEALAVVKRGLDISPNIRPLLQRLVIIYSLTGRDGEASAVAENLIKLHPKFTIERWAKRAPFKDQAVIERYVKAMRKAGLPKKPPLPLPDKPSIAVLPFTNMSEDPKQEYFADGMTDDLITDLSKISGLFVIARNSAFTYKGKTLKSQQISRELGVRYLLEGSVRKAGERVRINAQLIDAKMGGHLWAERYDGTLGDVFALQDEITRKIVAALAVKLTAAEQEAIDLRGTDNVEAYDAALQAAERFRQYTREDTAKAVTLYKKALELDPDYGLAHARLAGAYFMSFRRWWHKDLGWPDARSLAKKHLKMAIKNPTAPAHRIASLMLLPQRKHEEAIAEAERAMAMAPSEARSHFTMGSALIYAGRSRGGIDFIKRAMRLDPYYPVYYLGALGLAQFCMGKFKEAAITLERAQKRNPTHMRRGHL